MKGFVCFAIGTLVLCINIAIVMGLMRNPVNEGNREMAAACAAVMVPQKILTNNYWLVRQKILMR